MNILSWIIIITFIIFSNYALAGGGDNQQSANANRLILVTYWGDDKVALVDTQGQEGKEEVWAIDTLKTAGCAKPYDVRVDKKGTHAFASCSGNDLIAVIDIVAQLVEYTIKVGSSPRDLQLFSNDTRLIVANSGSDTVSIVDIPNRKVLYEVPVALQPYGVAITNSGKTALVTGWASGDLHILSLDQSSGKEITNTKVGLLPYTVVAPGDGDIAYVATNGEHAVMGVEVKTGKLINKIPVGRNPWSIAFNNKTGIMLVTNNRSNSLTLLKTGAARSTKLMSSNPSITFSAGADTRMGGALARAAKNVSISTDSAVAAFTDLANNQVVIMDTKTGELRKVIDVGKAPYGIEFISGDVKIN